MVNQRYNKYLKTYGIAFVLIAIMLIVNTFLLTGPGILRYGTNSMGTDIALLVLLWIGAGILGSVIGGFLLAPFFLFAQKNSIGRKMIYGIQDKKQDERFKGAFLKALFPALLATNFCLMFSQNATIQALLIPEMSLSGDEISRMLTMNALFPLMTGLGLGIFSPVWFLEDGGIVYSNKEKVKDKSKPTEMRSVGGWYLYLLKGYAGISVIINYFTFFGDLSSQMGDSGLMTLMFSIFWPIMPLLMAFMMTPGVLALDITFEKRRNFMRNSARKQGITEPLETI